MYQIKCTSLFTCPLYLYWYVVDNMCDTESIVDGFKICSIRKFGTHVNLLGIPQPGGEMSKRLDGIIIGCKDKTS